MTIKYLQVKLSTPNWKVEENNFVNKF